MHLFGIKFSIFIFLFSLSIQNIAAQSSRIKVWSNQDDSFIFVNDLCYDTVKEGETKVIPLQPGRYEVRIAKHSYKDYVQNIKLAPGMSLNIVAKLDKSDTDIYQNSVTIDSSPAQARIFLNETDMGAKTPHLFKNLPPGTYRFRLLLDLHYPTILEVPMKKNAELVFKEILKPSFGYLSISSTPQGARIYLNDKIIGRTPIKRLKTPSGQYTIKIEKDLFKTQQINTTVNDNLDTYINNNLLNFSGDLDLSTEPAVCAIYLNDTFRGKSPMKIKLPPGQYEMQLIPEMNSYKSINETIVILENKTTKIQKVLEVGFGTLSVRTTPDKAQIFLSSKYYGINKRFYGTSYTKVRNLPAGLYRLHVEKEDYRTEVRDLIVGDEETTEVELQLIRDRRFFKYGLMIGSTIVLASSLIGDFVFIGKVQDNRQAEDAAYLEYQEMFSGRFLEKKWNEYKKIYNKGKKYKYLAITSLAFTAISSITLFYSFTIPTFSTSDQESAFLIDPLNRSVEVCWRW